MGTVVFEGSLGGRKVAVKRLLKEFFTFAEREVSLLLESDEHPNVVRYYAKEEDNDFVYLALTYCKCSLADFVEERFRAAGSDVAQVDATAIQLMSDIAAGIEHIHKLKIVHRDIKPQNILIDTNGRARISDMGLAKKFTGENFSYSIGNAGSAGWQAPEIIMRARTPESAPELTPAVDVFALGCIFYYITTGEHPFGENKMDRDANILAGNRDTALLWPHPELQHLVESMTFHDARGRMRITDVINHPVFWDAGKRLQFLLAASDRIEVEKPQSELSVGYEREISKWARVSRWDRKLDFELLDDLTHHRRYNYDAARDLLRVMRNKANHYYDLPDHVRQTLGSLPEGFMYYFLSRFPGLLIVTYKYLLSACPYESMLLPYFPPL